MRGSFKKGKPKRNRGDLAPHYEAMRMKSNDNAIIKSKEALVQKIKALVDLQVLSQSLKCRTLPTISNQFEALEFYGDSVLSERISRFLLQTRRFMTPHMLSTLREWCVDNKNLAAVFDILEIGQLVHPLDGNFSSSSSSAATATCPLSKTVIKSKADVVEAMIGELAESSHRMDCATLSTFSSSVLDELLAFVSFIGEQAYFVQTARHLFAPLPPAPLPTPLPAATSAPQYMQEDQEQQPTTAGFFQSQNRNFPTTSRFNGKQPKSGFRNQSEDEPTTIGQILNFGEKKYSLHPKKETPGDGGETKRRREWIAGEGVEISTDGNEDTNNRDVPIDFMTPLPPTSRGREEPPWYSPCVSGDDSHSRQNSSTRRNSNFNSKPETQLSTPLRSSGQPPAAPSPSILPSAPSGLFLGASFIYQNTLLRNTPHAVQMQQQRRASTPNLSKLTNGSSQVQVSGTPAPAPQFRETEIQLKLSPPTASGTTPPPSLKQKKERDSGGDSGSGSEKKAPSTPRGILKSPQRQEVSSSVARTPASSPPPTPPTNWDSAKPALTKRQIKKQQKKLQKALLREANEQCVESVGGSGIVQLTTAAVEEVEEPIPPARAVLTLSSETEDVNPSDAIPFQPNNETPNGQSNTSDRDIEPFEIFVTGETQGDSEGPILDEETQAQVSAGSGSATSQLSTFSYSSIHSLTELEQTMFSPNTIASSILKEEEGCEKKSSPLLLLGIGVQKQPPTELLNAAPKTEICTSSLGESKQDEALMFDLSFTVSAANEGGRGEVLFDLTWTDGVLNSASKKDSPSAEADALVSFFLPHRDETTTTGQAAVTSDSASSADEWMHSAPSTAGDESEFGEVFVMSSLSPPLLLSELNVL